MSRLACISALWALLFFSSSVASATTVHVNFLSRETDLEFSGTSPGDLVAAVQSYSYSTWGVSSPGSAFLIDGSPASSALAAGQQGTVTAYDGDAGGVWDVSCYVISVDGSAPPDQGSLSDATTTDPWVKVVALGIVFLGFVGGVVAGQQR